jgi:hypothetical protein
VRGVVGRAAGSEDRFSQKSAPQPAGCGILKLENPGDRRGLKLRFTATARYRNQSKVLLLMLVRIKETPHAEEICNQQQPLQA